MKKFIIIFVAILTVGVLLFQYLTSDSRKLREFAADEVRLQGILDSDAGKAKKVEALEKFIAVANSNFQLNRQSSGVPPEVYHDVVVSYVKLGNLLEEERDARSEKYFNAAWVLRSRFTPWIKNYRIETKDDLRRYVADLEKKTKNVRQ